MPLTIDLNAQQVTVVIESGTVTMNRFVKAVPTVDGDIHIEQAGLGDPVFGVSLDSGDATVAPGTVAVDRSFPVWHQVESGADSTTGDMFSGHYVMSDADGKAVAWDSDDAKTIVGKLVSDVTTTGDLCIVNSSTVGTQSVGSAPPLDPSMLSRCLYFTTMSVPALDGSFQWEWDDHTGGPSDLGFHPFDLSDPANPVVTEAGVYAVNAHILPGATGAYSGVTYTGAGMWAQLQMDSDGFDWNTAVSASLDAAATDGMRGASLTVGNTVYLPVGAVNRLYFSHNAPDPTDFFMLTTVQRVA